MAEPLRWGDITVPYVALWSSETASFVGVCSDAGFEHAVFNGGSRGEGRPVFGKMDYLRQRICVSRKRCQVCYCKLERMFTMGTIPAWIEHGGMRRPLLSEPCVCASCAIYALDNCPGLKRQFADPKFLTAEVFEYDRVPCLLQAMDVSPYPDLDRVLKSFGKPAVGYVKLRMLKYLPMLLEDFRTVVMEAVHG